MQTATEVMSGYHRTTLLVLRIAVALIFLYHGFGKVVNPAGTSEFFAKLGFFGFLGPVVGWVEVIAGLLVLLGFWFNWATYALTIIIGVAVLFVQVPGAWKSGQVTAGLERDVLILISTLILAVHGPGRWYWKK